METKTTPVAEEHPLTYERPRIEDYGTLAELTAGLGGPVCDALTGAPGGYLGGTSC